MVLHHVAQRPALVVGRASLDPTVSAAVICTIDVAAVPDRLEHAVGEAEHHQVLDGLLPEVVIDAEDPDPR